MNAPDKEEAEWLGLDERSIRLECLRLALDSGSDAPIDVAERFAQFVLRGEVSDA